MDFKKLKNVGFEYFFQFNFKFSLIIAEISVISDGQKPKAKEDKEDTNSK